jgi:hypothetical protein
MDGSLAELTAPVTVTASPTASSKLLSTHEQSNRHRPAESQVRTPLYDFTNLYCTSRTTWTAFIQVAVPVGIENSFMRQGNGLGRQDLRCVPLPSQATVNSAGQCRTPLAAPWPC